MNDFLYLKRIFKNYYKENKAILPYVNSFSNREFGFIPWGVKTFMMRHMSFQNPESFTRHLTLEGPRHVYSSGALYTHPSTQDMEGKGYQGCDLIIDIDVDHFYTPCKENHDFWYCKECGESGKGMVSSCPKCKKSKLKTLTWICDKCLDVAKKEIIKLIYDFLLPDFGVNIDQIRIAFSGHRGYHLKIENEQIRNLSSDSRREIADYIAGESISFEILGLQEKGGIIYSFSKDSVGWAQKIIKKTADILEKPDSEIQSLLSNKEKFDFNNSIIKSFISSKNNYLNKIKNKQYFILPPIEGFALISWKKFFAGVVHEIGVEIDTPVTVDIHRLIRYPGSLHGKSGFKVQELSPDELVDFNPLNETMERLDPIVLKSKVQTTQKIEITAINVPVTEIKGEKFGPYLKGEIVEVPHHIAVFLLCKEVAKTI
ncbi:MAG: DNA primase small subunit domain-containing protein [Promethearchaeota archaeon]|jgi:DNA primase small subunit